MATGDQLKSPIKSCMEGDEAHFFSAAMQVAASESKPAHGKIAREIRALIDEWAPHVVYINGQSVLTPQLGEHSVEVRQIGPEFKTLMGG